MKLTLQSREYRRQMPGGVTVGYSVKQVSAMTGLPVSTLRYYDKMGLPPAFCLQMETGSDEMVTADSAVRKTESD
mgnify:CR=1 FL=1